MKSFFIFLFSFCISVAITLALIAYFFGGKNIINPFVPTFSVKNAPSKSLQADITALNGDTSWESRIATQPAKLTTPRQIMQGETLATNAKGNITFEFKNIEKVAMLANTQIDFTQTLPANIVLTQEEGNANYSKLGTIPVSISALTLLVNQEQGDMLVQVDKKQQTVTVQVETGSAKVGYTDNDNQTNVTTIPSGKIFVFDVTSQTGSIETAGQ